MSSGQNEENNGGWKRWRGKSFVELIVMLNPLLYAYVIIFPVLYVLNPDIPIFIISSVPNGLRVGQLGVMTFLVCLFLECLSFFILLTWGVYTFFNILSFVMTFRDQVKYAMDIFNNPNNNNTVSRYCN